MYKIIACDLDETLLSTDRHVSRRNVDAIRAAGARGVKFVPATGRGYKTVAGTLEELGLYQQPDEYVISFNGGAISENRDDRVLHFEALPFALAEKLYQCGLEYDVCIHVYTREDVYAWNLFPQEKAYLEGRNPIIEITDTDLQFLKGREIVKILYANTDTAYLRQIAEDLHEVTDGLDVSYSSGRYIEFNHGGVNKGAGLVRLADMLGVDPGDTIAIGDNFNDLSMIRDAGLGVGVANVADELRSECDYICSADHDHDAIAEVIEKFILNL
ncbi:MAG: Cof-type HAD-IIB family hydrolase [Eubacteriaceae bacterium]